MVKNGELVPNFKVHIPKKSISYVRKALESGWVGGDGPYGKKFETAIGDIIGNRNVIALNSGTSALQIALRLAGVAGAEVVTTPMTCIATNAAIVNEGGIPVWADVDKTTGNIDVSSIEKCISKKTKAIMVVHWGGTPADLDSIARIAKKYEIPVIEDAAQALGSIYKGRHIGTHSEFVAFSTQAIKIINTADGGFLATKRIRDSVAARKLRWYGIDRQKRVWNTVFNRWEFDIDEIGSKMQMTDVQAAIGLGQLPWLPKLLAHRRRVALLYEKALASSTHLVAQRSLPHSLSNYWMFTVICQNISMKKRLITELKKIGVQAETAHTRNDRYAAFLKYGKHDLPGVTHFNDCHLIIPVGHWVPIRKAREIAGVLASL